MGDLGRLVEGLADLTRELREAVRALNGALARLYGAPDRPPVHMDVARLEVDRLEFRLDNIDVEELQGELNIGITHSAKASAAAAAEPRADPAGSEPSASLPRVAIWPPSSEEAGDA